MQDILTVTLNPALDISTFADDIRPGPKLRCEAPSYDPGGGGLNVSRAIAFLGGESLALAAIGGSVGLHLASLLRHENVDFMPFPIRGETRQNLSVTDINTGEQFHFVLPGPEWHDEQVAGILDAILDAVTGPTMLVLSGSFPPGVPADFTAELNQLLRAKPVQLVADVSGPALRTLIDQPCRLHVLRMDAGEAETLAGRHLATRSDAADFAGELVQMGVARMVVIARGADGSILVDGADRHHCRCEVSIVRSKVGAGDSFLAGMVLALSKGASPADALRHGVAAASAAVLTDATDLCRQDDVLRLLDTCEQDTV